MPKPDLPVEYDFRAAEAADLALLGRWIAQPHWARWWGEPEGEVVKIREHLDSVSVEPLIVELDGDPIAYLQSYDPHLEDDHPYVDQPFGALGVRLSIGPETLDTISHGSAILAQFIEELFDEGATRVIADPHSANTHTIRIYEKVGFKALGERTNGFDQVLLMACDSPEHEG